MTAALALASLGWSGVLGASALWAWVKTRPAAPCSSAPAPSALLLRPCAGLEPHLHRALRSSSKAPVGTRIRFLVADPEDPARAVANGVADELTESGRDARVVVTRVAGPNRKVAQLAQALALEDRSEDLIVIADSDVDLSSEALDALLSPLARGEAAATWAPPVETCASTLADRASAAVLDASLHSFGLLSGIDRRGMVGKLFAVRRGALEAAGGFWPLVAHLGEDVELARRLRRMGGRVDCVATPARSVAGGRTWPQAIARYTRWLAVVRTQRTPLLASYPLLFASTPLTLVLGLVTLAFDRPSALLALAVSAGVRIGVGVLARCRAHRPIRPFALLLDGMLADMLLLVAFARVVLGKPVVWRGAPVRIGRRGLLAENE